MLVCTLYGGVGKHGFDQGILVSMNSSVVQGLTSQPYVSWTRRTTQLHCAKGVIPSQIQCAAGMSGCMARLGCGRGRSNTQIVSDICVHRDICCSIYSAIPAKGCFRRCDLPTTRCHA